MPRAGAAGRRMLGLLQAAWIRPLLLLIVLIGSWDLAIRIFHIPPYQIPAPIDVVKSLWSDWPELIAEAWPTTYATLAGFLLSALFGIPVAMLIAASRTVAKASGRRSSSFSPLASLCRNFSV